ncbi:MAG TPA: 4Fe-4S binding protein [Fibrobacteria bacterium]|nr:4Fe-4S binding protein [Fibrobacteria bacterium]HOX51880.1 4Fe-4S binding protein [Fibrobacteria bacterium]
MSILGWVREIVDGVQSTTTGLGLTARFIWENVTDKKGHGNAMTIDYPVQPAHVPDGFRGHLFNDVDRCTLCKSCQRACPIDCISMEGELNENAKFRISRYDIDLSKCIYCGLCTQACPTDCLTMTKGYELEPKNLVNGRGGRFLFRMRADQTKVKLDMLEVERLNRLTAQDPSACTDDDRAFLSRIEDPEKGQFLFARYGMGYYTPEEKAKVDQARADKKKAREQAAAQAAQLAAEQAAQQSDKAPGTAGT